MAIKIVDCDPLEHITIETGDVDSGLGDRLSGGLQTIRLQSERRLSKSSDAAATSSDVSSRSANF